MSIYLLLLFCPAVHLIFFETSNQLDEENHVVIFLLFSVSSPLSLSLFPFFPLTIPPCIPSGHSFLQFLLSPPSFHVTYPVCPPPLPHCLHLSNLLFSSIHPSVLHLHCPNLLPPHLFFFMFSLIDLSLHPSLYPSCSLAVSSTSHLPL